MSCEKERTKDIGYRPCKLDLLSGKAGLIYRGQLLRGELMVLLRGVSKIQNRYRYRYQTGERSQSVFQNESSRVPLNTISERFYRFFNYELWIDVTKVNQNVSARSMKNDRYLILRWPRFLKLLFHQLWVRFSKDVFMYCATDGKKREIAKISKSPKIIEKLFSWLHLLWSWRMKSSLYVKSLKHTVQSFFAVLLNPEHHSSATKIQEVLKFLKFNKMAIKKNRTTNFNRLL